MAHLILEYSANLDTELDVPDLFKELTDAAIETTVFPLAGLRCRAHRCEHYRVANSDSKFGFVHLLIKLGAGRTEEQKHGAAEVIFSALCKHLGPIYERKGLAISLEMVELPVTLKFNRNNIRDHLAMA